MTTPARPVAPSAFLDIDTRRWIRRLLVGNLLVGLAFMFLDYHVNYASWTGIGAMQRMFNITREDSLCSWLTVTETLLLALTVWLIYVVVRGQRPAKGRAAGWLLLAVFFTWMAVDDGAQIHERLGSTYKAMNERHGGKDDGEPVGRLGRWFPSYAWQPLLMPVFAAIGAFMAVFLWVELESMPARVGVAVALALFVLAIGLDFIEGLDPGHPLNLYTRVLHRFDLKPYMNPRFATTPYETVRHFSKSAEEFMEQMAIAVLWAVFVGHLGQQAASVQLRFASGPSDARPART